MWKGKMYKGKFPDNHDWTKPHFGVSHKMIDGIQYTIINYEKFVKLDIYSWISETMVSQHCFFVRSFGEDCTQESCRFWNCGNIENAIMWAKFYMGRYWKMDRYKDDLSLCPLPEEIV